MTQDVIPEEWIWNGSGKRKRDALEDSDDESSPTYLKYCRLDFSTLEETTHHQPWSRHSDSGSQSITTTTTESSPFLIQCTITPFCCSLPPFVTIASYEEHYEQAHEMVCNECKRILPSAHLLDLHLCEVHDSYFAVLAQKQHMYSCFVDGCQRKSLTPKARIRHLIEKHKYPRNFHFNVVLGYDPPSNSRKKKSSKKRLVPSSSQSAPEEMMDTSQTSPMDTTMATLTTSLSKLALPRSISFQRRQKKNPSSFTTVKQAHQANAPQPPIPCKSKKATSKDVEMTTTE